MFDSVFGEDLSMGSFAIITVVSIFLGFMISLVYKYTSRGNTSFLITLTLLPVIVQAIILMVNGNLGTSIAIMGAFGLVRFRSMPGTSKEILFVFLAMAVGLATGMGQIYLAMILTVICLGMLIILSKSKIFLSQINEKNLIVLIPENLDYEDIFEDIFKKYTESVSLEKTKTVNMGSCFELTYKVILKDKVKEKEFIDELRSRNGNLKIALSHQIEDSFL